MSLCFLQSRLLSSYLCSLVLLSIGCQAVKHPPSPDSNLNESSPTTSELKFSDVLYFRNLFHKFAAAQGISDEEFQKVVLVPDEAVLKPSAARLAASGAKTADEILVAESKSWTALKFYQNSLSTPFEDVDTEAPFRDGPATFIIVPGIFGEFINKKVFNEIFEAPNTFRQAHEESLKKITDPSYSLSKADFVDVNLSERIFLGGTDHPITHEARIQAIFLKAGFGSGETLGNNADNAAIFLRRLNKVFTQIPLEKCRKIYLVGYSQGASVILDMLDQIKQDPERYPFSSQLKGLISLSGVLYGTEASDDAYFNPKSANFKMLNALQTTLDGLKPARDGRFITATGVAFQNWQSLISLAVKLAKIPAPPVNPGQEEEKLIAPAINPAMIVEYLSHIFSDLIQGGLSPKSAVANIQGAKLLLNKVIEATKNLSTEARIAWWANHTIPSNIAVYTVATSMPDPSSKGFASPLINSPYFGTDTIDYSTVLRPGFYSLYDVSQVPLNDSQVLTAKEVIFPSLVTKWNPAQKPFPTYFLGIMGTHHWGVAFDRVFEAKDDAKNMFPRRAFVEALGAFVLTKP